MCADNMLRILSLLLPSLKPQTHPTGTGICLGIRPLSLSCSPGHHLLEPTLECSCYWVQVLLNASQGDNSNQT
jgi:hypothetical protein